MHITQLLADSALRLISGSVGTKVMKPVAMKLYELEPEAERQQEDRVRPGPPYAHRRSEDSRLPRALAHLQAGGAGRVGFSPSDRFGAFLRGPPSTRSYVTPSHPS